MKHTQSSIIEVDELYEAILEVGYSLTPKNRKKVIDAAKQLQRQQTAQGGAAK